MASNNLDSIVKGAPTSETNTPHGTGTTPISPPAGKQGDPLSNTPSSPSMIYLNLLILEASLRAQYLELRARRRHHTFFLILLFAWVTFFGYLLYFAPREDGNGVGGSIYWAVEGAQKVCFMGGIVTTVLVWATGIWERGIRWPRRWLAISNRGLRSFNCKLVVVRRPWWAEVASTLGFFLTYGLFSNTSSSSYRGIEPSLMREVEKDLQHSPGQQHHPTLILPSEDEERGGHEEDLSPGGDYVKLLLLAKPFSPAFRENWENYRAEYWERENERRSILRKKVKEQDLKHAKQQYGWFWWLPWAQNRSRKRDTPRGAKVQPQPHAHHRQVSSVEKEHRRRGSTVRHGSASSSRSATPVPDEDGRKPFAASASDKRRKKSVTLSKTKRSGTGPDSRPATPDFPSPLSRESSVFTESGTEDGRTLRSARTRHRSGSIKEREKRRSQLLDSAAE